MYRKKLATRALTAIAASALLVSNVTTAAAASANVAQLVSSTEEKQKLEENKPEETEPEETQPEETQPEETEPEETQPEETQPEETEPEETQPEETQPEETQPEETEPEETEPEETEPEETEPEETEPEETKPEETQPVETQPEETKPADNQLLMADTEKEEKMLFVSATIQIADYLYPLPVSLNNVSQTISKDELERKLKEQAEIDCNHSVQFSRFSLEEWDPTQEPDNQGIIRLNATAEIIGKANIVLKHGTEESEIFFENVKFFDNAELKKQAYNYILENNLPYSEPNDIDWGKQLVNPISVSATVETEYDAVVTLRLDGQTLENTITLSKVTLNDLQGEAVKEKLQQVLNEQNLNYNVQSITVGTKPQTGRTWNITADVEKSKFEEIELWATADEDMATPEYDLGTLKDVDLDKPEDLSKKVNDAITNNAILGALGAKYTGEYRTAVKDGKQILVVKINLEEPKPEETVTVTAYFKDSNYLDVSELGTNGKMEFAGVKLSDIEAFKKQVIDYVTSMGYEVVEIETPAAGSLSINVIVKRPDTPTPTPEQATSKLTIQFKFGNRVLKSQELSYTGEKGSTTVITKAVVDSAWVPSGYQVSSYFDDATLTYGTDLTLVVTLRLAGGGGTSGSGSGSGSSGTIAASGVLANGDWMQDNVGWWYSFKNGSYAKNGWYTLEWRDRLDWYYFNADGYLVSGWYTDAAGNRYYLHPEHDGTFGRMYTGWNKVDGSWQFFNDDLQSSTYGAWAANTPVPTELQNK